MPPKNTNTRIARQPPAIDARSVLVDELVERYLRWREACNDVHDTYDRWRHATDHDRRTTHAAYNAALDREQCAANHYRKLTETITDAATANAA